MRWKGCVAKLVADLEQLPCYRTDESNSLFFSKFRIPGACVYPLVRPVAAQLSALSAPMPPHIVARPGRSAQPTRVRCPCSSWSRFLLAPRLLDALCLPAHSHSIIVPLLPPTSATAPASIQRNGRVMQRCHPAGPLPRARVPASRAAARALRDAEPGAGLQGQRLVCAEGSCP